MTIIETGATAPDLGGLIVGRLNRMASGDPKWDLSPTDRAAIKVVVAALGALELEREALSAQNAALKEALRFYADPSIYKPHPHGPAFDRRDLSFRARTAIKEAGADE